MPAAGASGREATTDTSGAVGELVENVFRRSAGRMVATLTRVLGPDRMDLAEGVVQDALVKALQTWPYAGVPRDPAAWLFRVARNRALDLVRGQNTRRRLHESMAGSAPSSAAAALPVAVLEPVEDDELAMIFMCCHPGIPSEGRLALTLRTVGGFSTNEIASAFLSKRTAIQQRIVRAKRRVRDLDLRFELPGPEARDERLDSVLTVLYLLFNEGYSASHGDSLVRRELCREAIRLCGLLLEQPGTAQPRTHALMALMLLQASRLDARQAPGDVLILLQDQDRSHWDRGWIQSGLRHLDRAASGLRLSRYHLEAGIAAEHAVARSWEETDWAQIRMYYDQLSGMTRSPVVSLNRAVAVAMLEGPEAGLEALATLRDPLSEYYLLSAVEAELLVRAGRREDAEKAYDRAVELAVGRPEHPWLSARRARTESRPAAGYEEA